MTIRHEAVKRTLDKGYASEWNADHVPSCEDRLLSWWTFPGHTIPGEFTTSELAGAEVVTELSENHNWLKVQTTAVGGNEASLILGDRDTTNRLDLPLLDMAVKLDTTGLAEFGFFDYDTAAFTADQDGAYFRVVGNVLFAVTGNGADETATNLGPPPEYGHYRIVWAAADVKFYVDDMATFAAKHTTHITAEDLTARVSAKNPDGAQQTLHLDGLGLLRLRKQG